MATPQSKIRLPEPEAKTKRPAYLPIRFLPQMREDFFLSFETAIGHEEFVKFCNLNNELRIERTAEGVIEIMPPAFWETGNRNADLTAQIMAWAKQDSSGVAADSSAGYRLPNGATRAPDASWVARARLAALKPEEKKEYLPLCPDFVVELRSSSDRLKRLKEKMEEYLANGARLGWLIDPSTRKVYVYRPAAEVEVLDDPATVSGDPILPGFTLDLRAIWEPDF
jgi:Uma2 family endonuclease